MSAANAAPRAPGELRAKITQAAQSVILAALGLFVLAKIVTGQLGWYINERYLLITLAGGLGLAVLAVLNVADRHAGAEHHHEHDEVDEYTIDHPDEARPAPRRAALSGWLWLLMALPAVLGLLVPARPLGSSAVANKGISSTAPLTAGGNTQPAKAQLAPTDRTILDWVRAFNFESDPAVFNGQAADVIGFVYHDTRLSAGQFLVVRFGITCCVADAAAIGMVVNWPQAAALADNSWVRVRGTVSAATLGGRPEPQIQASVVDAAAEPANPYLYP
jgi:uncharacterized repeat protein (TIGR03943 family)